MSIIAYIYYTMFCLITFQDRHASDVNNKSKLYIAYLLTSLMPTCLLLSISFVTGLPRLLCPKYMKSLLPLFCFVAVIPACFIYKYFMMDNANSIIISYYKEKRNGLQKIDALIGLFVTIASFILFFGTLSVVAKYHL